MAPQTHDEVQYEFKTVQAIRGRENKTKTKWQNEGWEFVTETQGTLRTELNLRRVKPKTFGAHVAAAFAAFRRMNPKAQWALAAAAGLVLLGAVIGIAAAAPGGSETAEPSAVSKTPSSAPTLSASTSAEPSTTPATKAPPAEPKVTDISVDDLLDKLNAGESKAGDRFRITGELFQSDQWSTGVTGDYSVMLKAQSGKQDLPIFVDESEAEKWTDGTKVELILKNVEKTTEGETSDGWLEVQSATILSGGTTKEDKEAASRHDLLAALDDYADTLNSGVGTTVIDSIGPGTADGVYYVNLNPAFASLSKLEAQSAIKTMNGQIVNIFDAKGSSVPMLKYFLAGDVVAENKEILDPSDVKFKGMLDD